MSSASQPIDFTSPFKSHLPGFLAHSEQTAPGIPDPSVYTDHVSSRWQDLINSPASHDEKLLQAFLEHHPCLLPGPFSVDGPSGHLPHPTAVITQPSLPGLSSRRPDFMWIASDSESIYPVLIEIETPHKKWFYGKRAEIHSDFTHAQGQLAEWRGWFRSGTNRAAFFDNYEVPSILRRRTLQPRFVLIYGRRTDYADDQARQVKRGELAREGERLMSFDRLAPSRKAAFLACVTKDQHGYRAEAIPPSFALYADERRYEITQGWEEAIDRSLDMAVARREFLKAEIYRSKLVRGERLQFRPSTLR